MKRDGGTKRGVARGSAFAVALVALSMMTLPPTLATAGGGIVSTFERSLGTAAAHPEKGRRALGSQRGKVHLQMMFHTSPKRPVLRRTVLTIRSGKGHNAAMLKVEATKVGDGLEKFVVQHVAPAQEKPGALRRVLTKTGKVGTAPDVVFTDSDHPMPRRLDLSESGTPAETRLAATIETDTRNALQDASAFKGLDPAVKRALEKIAQARYPGAATVEKALGFVATALDE